jgi:hypothetical protein
MTPQPEPEGALRMYVITNRSILPLVHCIVQTSHSSSEYTWYHRDLPSTKKWVEEDRTMIVLDGTMADMGRVMEQFASKSMKYQPFYEPDMGNVLTSVAFQPITKEEAVEYFAGLRLIK